MDQELAKRISAAHKEHVEKAHHHLKKAAECHGKACEAFNNLSKCMGKADGANPLAQHVEHMKALRGHLSDMADHHQMAHQHLQAAKASWTGEGKEAPTAGENGDVTDANRGAVDLLPQHSLTEGPVSGSSFQGAGDSPYSAAAIALEVKKALDEATKPLNEKLAKMTEENAFMKGQMAVLEKLPSGGARPRLMSGSSATDLSFLGSTDTKAAVNGEIAKAYQGIDPEDPNSAIQAGARIIGLRAMNPELFAKRITDPEFKGGAGR